MLLQVTITFIKDCQCLIYIDCKLFLKIESSIRKK